jgi:hypothetical protein
MNFNKFLKTFVIFLLIFVWIFSGFPRIWPRRKAFGFLRGKQKPAIPPGIGVALSTTAALLTGVLAFAILKIVNPPRAVFGPCGVFIFGKNL